MDKILVAVDFSDIAPQVLDKAAEIALAFKSKIHLLHVIAPTTAFIGNEIVPQVIVDEHTEENERILSELKAMVNYLEKKNIDVTSELTEGPIADTILAKATLLSSDMIILGAHHHGFIYRAFIGSISTEIVKNPPCPILIIPVKIGPQ
jgi:nucleotide-binding universal stress UspA family protein